MKMSRVIFRINTMRVCTCGFTATVIVFHAAESIYESPDKIINIVEKQGREIGESTSYIPIHVASILTNARLNFVMYKSE